MSTDSSLAMLVHPDFNGLMRGRSLPTGRVAHVLQAGLPWVPANFLISPLGTMPADNPFGARGEIQSLVNELARDGLGVLMISSDLEELVEGSSRVVVLRDGAAVGELHRAELTQDAIIHAMAGVDVPALPDAPPAP